MSWVEVAVGLAIVVGIVGVVVPVLPGGTLVLAAILVWALHLRQATGWVVLGVAAAFLLLGTVAKFAVPGRRLQDAGIPSSTQWTGVAFAVVGFFVVPVVGLFIGFVLGMYVAERRRVGPVASRATTRTALAAVGLMILIEFTATVLAAGTWVVGVVVT